MIKSEPSVIDLDLFRQLLAEQVRDGEITLIEADRCWRTHALPIIAWRNDR